MALKMFFLSSFLFLSTNWVLAQELFLQGNPVLYFFNEAKSISEIKTAAFKGENLPVFSYNNKPTILFGIDLNQKPGSYGFVYELQNGDIFARLIRVEEREKPQEELGIPQSLGGNTPQAQTALVNNLGKENSLLSSLDTGKKVFWSEPFAYPVSEPIVTSDYGYVRETGKYLISHKGVDFRASEGTSVKSINRGVARLVKDFTVYGKTIVIDHGLGVMSMYMHLSKANINAGELVLPGQVIGLAGKTGYAENPHLHLSVRINNISIDPIQFLRFFKE